MEQSGSIIHSQGLLERAKYADFAGTGKQVPTQGHRQNCLKPSSLTPIASLLNWKLALFVAHGADTRGRAALTTSDRNLPRPGAN